MRHFAYSSDWQNGAGDLFSEAISSSYSSININNNMKRKK